MAASSVEVNTPSGRASVAAEESGGKRTLSTLLPGAFGYGTGTGSGTVNVPAGALVTEISCVAGGVAGTAKIGAGADITVPADAPLTLALKSELRGAVAIAFTSMATYLVTWTVP